MQYSFIPPIDSPGFTALKECGQNRCSVDFFLVFREMQLRSHTFFLSLPNVIIALAILLVTTASAFAKRKSAKVSEVFDALASARTL